MESLKKQVQTGDAQSVFENHSSLPGFGPVYMLTVIFFLSGGRYPIYDRFADIGATVIDRDIPPGKDIQYRSIETWDHYERYKRLLDKIAQAVNPSEEFISRSLDRALWAYGHLFPDRRIAE